MSFSQKYFSYVKSAFAEHKLLFIFTVLIGVFCWVGRYYIADWMFTPQELHNYEYLAQETFFSFEDMMYIIVNNCYINIVSYIESIFLCYGALYDMILNIGTSGITSRATELA